jgi:ATP-dependent DNA helicase RecG
MAGVLPPVLEKARKILLHEQRLGHTDQAVRPGGLEAFLERWAEEVAHLRGIGALDNVTTPQHSARLLEQELRHLLRGYRALDPMQRAAQVRAALARLAREDSAQNEPGRPGDSAMGSQGAPASLPPRVSRLQPSTAAAHPTATPSPRSSGGQARVGSAAARGFLGEPPQAAPRPPTGHYVEQAQPARNPQRQTPPGSFVRRGVLAEPEEAAGEALRFAEDELAEPVVLESTVGPAAVESHFLLRAQVTVVPGVGPSQEAKLQRLGIHTVQDLLLYFPREHHDYSKLERIALIPLEQVVTIMGMIWEVENVRSASGRVRTLARISDETGQIRAVWFNQPYLAKQLTRGSYIVLTGMKQRFGNHVEFHVRSHELPEHGDLVNTGRLVPVYNLTEGLNAKALRRYTKWAVDRCGELLVEYLPATIRSRAGLLPLPQAVGQYHYPENEARLVQARRRLAFDELFLIQLGMLSRRAEWSSGAVGVALPIDPGLIFAQDGAAEDTISPAGVSQPGKPQADTRTVVPALSPGKVAGSLAFEGEYPGGPSGLWKVAIEQPFEASLPFRFTKAQRRVIQEILADLRQARPMCRLLQGDVGSGKTVVAAAGLLAAAANGYQGVLMAPTEILAEQHHRTLVKLLEPFGIRVALLTGSQKSKERAGMLEAIASGESLVIVGTHALIQEGVSFARLGFVVVDEQHRFGVSQRDALRQKGYNPHMLVMTATPIPRTLALTLYGDLDISMLDEMPAGRQQIITRWRSGTRRAEAYHVVAEQVAQGRQAYVICPLIEESETLEIKAAVAEYERLRAHVFPTLRLGLAHGGLKSNEKEQVMRRFRDGELDVLVATAVVEVGVDVPNATVMVIEDADHFGISQLHQFRGRVGRGEHQSYCFVLSEGSGPQAQERLSIIERTLNGFQLAEEDLKLRGPGDFFGTRQSGLPELRVANLADTRLLEEARGQAEWLWSTDPQLEKSEHRLLRERVAAFWGRFVGH